MIIPFSIIGVIRPAENRSIGVEPLSISDSALINDNKRYGNVDIEYYVDDNSIDNDDMIGTNVSKRIMRMAMRISLTLIVT